MTPTTKTVPASLSFTPWLPGYVILGTHDYKCFRRLKLQELMEVDMHEDAAFIMRLKCASLTTNAIIRRIIAGIES